MKKWLQKQDSYANPIELKFKGDSQIRSVFGGVVSLLSKAVMLFFLFNKIMELVEKESNREALLSSVDVILSPGEYILT